MEPNHPKLVRFKNRKPQNVEAFAAWVKEERVKCIDKQGQAETITDTRNPTDYERSVTVPKRPCQSLNSACLAANGVLSLLNLACYLLDRQVDRLAKDFEKEGGFTERLYRVCSAKRRNKS